MRIERYSVGPLDTNCYQVICERTNASVIIDPGGITDELLDAVRRHPVSAVLLTHGHFDHTVGLAKLCEETGAPVHIHPADRDMLTSPYLNGSYMIGAEIVLDVETIPLVQDDEITFGESSLRAAETPGHSPGGVLLASSDGFVVSGDTVFHLSVGRWDLPGGSYPVLMNTIKYVIKTLPDDTVIYPGHGESTTVGFEKQHNQFFRNL